MYATTPTKLPLATFAQILGMNPLHFAQVYFKPTTSETSRSNCANVMLQHEWQGADAISREEIARAIAEAETNIERELGYRLLPSWEVDEWQATSRYNDRALSNFNSRDIRGYPQSVRAAWGNIISGGQRATTLLGADRPITYSDDDLDGYDETATVTATVAAGTSACEVRVFYPGKSAAPEWEIRPARVAVVGVTATIIFRRELAVLEALQEALEPNEVEGDDDAAFLEEVDVYRVYNDPSAPATLLWNNFSVCGCGSSGCPTCEYSAQTGCLNIIGDPLLGNLSYSPAEWDADANGFTILALTPARQPDIVRLWYYAGLRDKSQACPLRDMDRAWQRTVANYAASMLDRPPCSCVQERWERLRVDRAFTGGAEETSSYTVTASDLGNPLGTRHGAIEAWRRINSRGQVRADVASLY